MTFTGRSNEDQSDRSSWSRSVEGRFQRVMAKVTSQDIVDRAVTAAKLALASISSEHLVAAIPRGILGYATKTADQTGIGSTPTDITGLSTTVTVGTSRRIKVTVHVLLSKAGGAGAVVGEIFEDAAPVTRFTTKGLSDGEFYTPEGGEPLAPSAGAHTYKAVLYRATGVGTVDVLAAAGYKGWILVEDIGAA